MPVRSGQPAPAAMTARARSPEGTCEVGATRVNAAKLEAVADVGAAAAAPMTGPLAAAKTARVTEATAILIFRRTGEGYE